MKKFIEPFDKLQAWLEEKRTQGVWWRRTLLGAYGPILTRLPDGSFAMVEKTAVKPVKAPVRLDALRMS